MRHSNISIPLAIHNGGSIFKMADQLEIHEGENGVIWKLFSPLFKISRCAEGGDYIKFGSLFIESR